MFLNFKKYINHIGNRCQLSDFLCSNYHKSQIANGYEYLGEKINERFIR